MLFYLKTDQKKPNRDIQEKIYAPHGSCIILNKNYFKRGGTLDHISFLFGEEIFVGETAKRLGLNVLYVSEIQVRHYEHSSIGNFISRKINKFYRQSIKDILASYYN
jgi:GT2 family glycosyltransferase